MSLNDKHFRIAFNFGHFDAMIDGFSLKSCSEFEMSCLMPYSTSSSSNITLLYALHLNLHFKKIGAYFIFFEIYFMIEETALSPIGFPNLHISVICGHNLLIISSLSIIPLSISHYI